LATFVIVHAGWGGARSWNKLVVPMLREAGQTTCAVTLTFSYRIAQNNQFDRCYPAP